MNSLRVDVALEPPDSWQSFSANHGLFYHDPRWVLALAERFRFRIFCLTAEQGGEVVGTMALAEIPALFGPRRLVSLPFSYAAGPAGPVTNAIGALYETACDLARKEGVKRVEIKRRNPTDEPGAGFQRSSHYSTYIVCTSEGEDAVWSALNRDSTRRGIRRAEKMRVTAEHEDSPQAWRVMARLQERTSARLGLPPPPREFFVDTCRELQRFGIADLSIAYTPEGKAASGMVMWKGPREWIYAFGASDPRYMSVRPVHALLWQALQEAVNARVMFDLGRASPEQEGLTLFKRRWGGEPVKLGYDYWPTLAGLNTLPRDRGVLAIAGRMWSALPSSITAKTSFLYRYLG